MLRGMNCGSWEEEQTYLWGPGGLGFPQMGGRGAGPRMETFSQGLGAVHIHQVPRGQKLMTQRMRGDERRAAGMAPKGPVFTCPHQRHLQHISCVGGGALPLDELHRWEGQTRCPSQGTYTFGKFQVETECLLMLCYRWFWTAVKRFTVWGIWEMF